MMLDRIYGRWRASQLSFTEEACTVVIGSFRIRIIDVLLVHLEPACLLRWVHVRHDVREHGLVDSDLVVGHRTRGVSDRQDHVRVQVDSALVIGHRTTGKRLKRSATEFKANLCLRSERLCSSISRLKLQLLHIYKTTVVL